jgi:hypothetical protein
MIHDCYVTDKYGTTAIIRRYSGLAEACFDPQWVCRQLAELPAPSSTSRF